MLNDVIGFLICPVCGEDLALDGAGDGGGPVRGSLRCPAGHLFDIARQGYVSLLAGGGGQGTADTGDMVRARAEFLGSGHFQPLVSALADLVHETKPADGCVLDAGAGTGHHLAAVLDRSPGTWGIALDLSKHALRRAASAHPRIGAVGCDLWRALPVRGGAMAAVMNVFAPRNAAEFRRVLRPDGVLIVVTPTRRHLAGLIEPLGMISVDERKDERVAEALSGHFRPEARMECEMELSLRHDEVSTLVGMGPNAWHVNDRDLRSALAALPDPVPVTASFVLSVFRPQD